MLDKLTLEDLEKISKDLSVAKTSNEDKQKVLSAFAQKLVRDGLATTENLSQFGTGRTYYYSLSMINPANCPVLIFSFPIAPIETVERVAKKTTETIAPTVPSSSSPSASGSSNVPTKEWSVEEVALLIKAANKFPGGVSDRWDTIAAYVALHTGLPQRDSEDVIKKSKAVQKGSSQEATVRQLQFQKKTYDIADAPSVRYDIEGEVPPVVAVSEETKTSTAEAIAAAAAVGAGSKTKPKKKAPTVPADVPATAKAITPTHPVAVTPPSSGKTAALAAVSSPIAAAATPSVAPPAASLWTTAEQKSLEAGLKSFPPSWQGEGDRWDKIAGAVPGRTKKECKLRVKVKKKKKKEWK